jgi:hypothetical protein
MWSNTKPVTFVWTLFDQSHNRAKQPRTLCGQLLHLGKSAPRPSLTFLRLEKLSWLSVIKCLRRCGRCSSPTFGSAVSSDPGDSGALIAVIQTVTYCLLQSVRTVVVAVRNRTSLIVNPVSSMTSRWAQASKLSPCSRCPPGWAM